MPGLSAALLRPAEQGACQLTGRAANVSPVRGQRLILRLKQGFNHAQLLFMPLYIQQGGGLPPDLPGVFGVPQVLLGHARLGPQARGLLDQLPALQGPPVMQLILFLPLQLPQRLLGLFGLGVQVSDGCLGLDLPCVGMTPGQFQSGCHCAQALAGGLPLNAHRLNVLYRAMKLADQVQAGQMLLEALPEPFAETSEISRYRLTMRRLHGQSQKEVHEFVAFPKTEEVLGAALAGIHDTLIAKQLWINAHFFQHALPLVEVMGFIPLGTGVRFGQVLPRLLEAVERQGPLTLIAQGKLVQREPGGCTRAAKNSRSRVLASRALHS
ncbi:hypothetical protein [Deinococcus multiflagellatus]|uniref:Uncharacterized protein n=1 Tax=Deinococcus multiflagellatus TaxID=1656887 RepID=A0ABW1ZKE0_9DEIO